MVDHFHTSTFHCALVGVTFVVAAADWFKRSGPCIYTDEKSQFRTYGYGLGGNTFVHAFFLSYGLDKLDVAKHSFVTDRLAVILLHFATIHSFGTTVAAIISTSFVIVTVVAIAVSLVL